MNKAILILGASGFIGRHLAQNFAAGGCDVIAATRSPAYFEHPHIRNLVSTFIRREDFLPLLQECDVVFHTASSSTPGSSAAQPQLDGNLRTTLALIEALQENSNPRVVFISSGGTLYGDTPAPVNENAMLHPRSYHAAGKIAAEYFLQAWAAQYAGDATLLRPSNVYGPGQLPKPGFGIIPTAFEKALNGTPLHVLGDGSAVRDYLHIDDFFELCLSIIGSEQRPGCRVFNVASETCLSLNALLDAIDCVTGHPLLRYYEPTRVIDIQRILLDNSAARHTYNWQPRVSINEGLAATWAWRRQRA